MSDSRHRWNARWQDRKNDPEAPDRWLVDVLPLLPKGTVLDVACGQGRNTLFLADHGFSVTAVDISEAGLQQLAAAARLRKLTVETWQTDLEDAPNLPAGPFDVLIDFFYLHRPILPTLLELVRPGGIVVLRTFSSAGPFDGGLDNPAFVLQPGELLKIFAGWDILRHEEGLEPSRKGGSLAGIVARRPL